MRVVFISLFFLLFNKVLGQSLPQSSLKFLEENTKDFVGDPTSFKYDFSQVIGDRQDAVIGIIGDIYQKLDVYFLSIEKDKQRERVYCVVGKSRVKSNVCDFEGEIEITNVFYPQGNELRELYNQAVSHGDTEAMKRFEKS